MSPQYPLFILVKDELSIRMVTEPRGLGWYEEIDIEDDLYCGWDVQGYPLRLTWERKVGPKVELTDNVPQPDKLREEVLNYTKRYTKGAFDCGEAITNIVDLFVAFEKYQEALRPPSIMSRIMRFLGWK